MDKRLFMQALLGAVGLAGSAALAEPRRVAAGGMDFRWIHRDERLHCTLSGKTEGWIAVGFNAARPLANTRFVIASAGGSLRIEEHIALVPDHRSVEALGIAPALAATSGQYAYGMSLVAFSLPQQLPDLNLASGVRTHLMLAWSHHADFDHHSAWRKHFDITL